MARQKYTIPTLSCEDDLAALIAFMCDRDKVEAAVAQIKAARDEALARINQVGDAQEIETLRSEASADREAARRELEAARAEARETRDKAGREIAEMKAGVQRERGANQHEAAQRKADLDRREEALGLREKAAARLASEAQAAKEAADRRRVEADAVVAEYEDKRNRLKEAMG